MSAYPNEDLAQLIGEVGLVAVAVAYVVAQIFARKWPLPVAVTTLAALSAAVVYVCRLHGHTGEPSDCFLSKPAIATLTVVCPIGLVLCAIALAVTRLMLRERVHVRRWLTVTIVVLALALAGRLGHMLSLETYDRADQRILAFCLPY